MRLFVNKPSLWAARGIFAASLGFTSLASAPLAGFDGLICQGLNDNIGTVRQSEAVTSVLHLTNISLYPITVLQEPTCGCQLTKVAVMTLPPFSTRTLTIPYRVGMKEHGKRTRTILLYTRHLGNVQRLEGTSTFFVK